MLSARRTRWRISATSRTSSLSWILVGVTSARRARRSRLRTMRAARSTSRTMVAAAAGLRLLGGASEQLGLHADRGERIVDLVGHAARDLADRRQLLAGDQ